MANTIASRNATRGERGFTIMELLIVMGISLFGMAGLMSVYTSTAGANQGVSQSAEAIDICEQTMEGFRSMSVAQIETDYSAITGTGWGPVTHFDGFILGRNEVHFERQISAAEVPSFPGLVRIDVVVSWADDGEDPTNAATLASEFHSVTLQMVRTRLEAL
ncbi:MAG: prepilin-type N-terminal cleavage/methylation domain-containing protein [Kofleriaceae bacterium]|nr:prepilin-type N-terminal cleavage/methylation domain-containing protein [Kofleriaceae bacterium]